MCRADVAEQAVKPLAALLVDVARILAEREGVDPASVRIGPVDFGGEKEMPADIAPNGPYLPAMVPSGVRRPASR